MTPTAVPAAVVPAARTTTVDRGDVSIRVVQRGAGPDVLFIGGLTDPAESWQPQLDTLCHRFRVTTFDNRGAGYTPLGDGELTVEKMTDDAAAVLRHLGIESAHVAGFSGGSRNAQDLALRHPELVRSLVLMSSFAEPDPMFLRLADLVHELVDRAPDERTMLEWFFLFIYTGRAHANGFVDAVIEEALASPMPPPAIHEQLTAWMTYRNRDRLSSIRVPTLVISGGEDVMALPRHGGQVAGLIPGAEFVVMEGEAHQPFQEVPEDFNAIVTAFWDRLG